MANPPANYLGPDDCENTWLSLAADKPGGAKFGSLVHYARKGGYRGLATLSLAEQFQGVAVDPPNNGSSVKSHPARPKRKLFAVLTRDDLLNSTSPCTYFGGWLPARSVAIWYGAKNTYKSFTLFNECLSEAKNNGTRIIWFTGEGSNDGLNRRILAWETDNGCPMPPSVVLVKGVPPAHECTAENIREMLASEGITGPFDILVLDTLTRMLTGTDPSDFEAASKVYDLIEGLGHMFGCAVVGVGHTGKDASKGLLGSVVLTANADVVVRVDSPDPDQVRAGKPKLLSSKWVMEAARDIDSPDDREFHGEVFDVTWTGRDGIAQFGRTLKFNRAKPDETATSPTDKAVQPSKKDRTDPAWLYAFLSVLEFHADPAHLRRGLETFVVADKMLEWTTETLGPNSHALPFEVAYAEAMRGVSEKTLKNWMTQARSLSGRHYAHEPVLAQCWEGKLGGRGGAFLFRPEAEATLREMRTTAQSACEPDGE